MKKIAAVNDLSGFGKCSLTAALPIISALGVQCCPLVTGVYSNQTDYESYYGKDLTEDLLPCIEQWKKLNVSFDAIITGFISSSRQGAIINHLIDSFKTENTVLTVDPVMGDNGKPYKSYDKKCIDAVISLAERADIITPNLTELCILGGKDYESLFALSEKELLREVEDICRELSEKKERIIITTGIHFEEKIVTSVYENGRFDFVVSSCHKGSFSGTGDILASFVTAQYIKGTPINKAVNQACRFIYEAIDLTVKETGGNFNGADGINFEKILFKLGDLK